MRPLLLVISLLAAGSGKSALAGFVDETMEDVFAYWRLDERPRRSTAADLGPHRINGTYVDVTLGEPGLIPSESASTAARFDGRSSGVNIPNFEGLNLTLFIDNPFVEKSILLWFNADDVSKADEQTIYEQGGGSRGLNVYVRAGFLYVGAWNNENWDGGVTTPWDQGPGSPTGSIFLSTPISSGETYQVGLVMAGDPHGKKGTITGYLNGQPFAEQAGVGQLFFTLTT
jgi:hypothetical protein